MHNIYNKINVKQVSTFQIRAQPCRMVTTRWTEISETYFRKSIQSVISSNAPTASPS